MYTPVPGAAKAAKTPKRELYPVIWLYSMEGLKQCSALVDEYQEKFGPTRRCLWSVSYVHADNSERFGGSTALSIASFSVPIYQFTYRKHIIAFSNYLDAVTNLQ